MFFGFVLFVIVWNLVDIVCCCEVFVEGKMFYVEGVFVIIKCFVKLGYGYILFKVGDCFFRMEIFGVFCDCGFICLVGCIINL